MIVSDHRKFVFIHNPKCGGTSVRQALMPFDTTANFFWMHDTWHGKQIDKAHMPLFLLRSRYPEYFRLLADYVVFAFVRDPYARVVSAFNESHIKLYEAMRTADELVPYLAGLNEFVLRLTRDALSGWHPPFRHFVRQRDLIYLGGKRHVDLVMRIEEWPGCLDRLAVLLPDVAAVLRASSKANTRALPADHVRYLSPPALLKIQELYNEDFTLFGYPAST